MLLDSQLIQFFQQNIYKLFFLDILFTPVSNKSIMKLLVLSVSAWFAGVSFFLICSHSYWCSVFCFTDFCFNPNVRLWGQWRLFSAICWLWIKLCMYLTSLFSDFFLFCKPERLLLTPVCILIFVLHFLTMFFCFRKLC